MLLSPFSDLSQTRHLSLREGNWLTWVPFIAILNGYTHKYVHTPYLKDISLPDTSSLESSFSPECQSLCVCVSSRSMREFPKAFPVSFPSDWLLQTSLSEIIWEIRGYPWPESWGARSITLLWKVVPCAISHLFCPIPFQYVLLSPLQIQYLDSMNGEDLLLTGEVSWRPLVEKNPQSVLKPHSPVYNDEGLWCPGPSEQLAHWCWRTTGVEVPRTLQKVAWTDLWTTSVKYLAPFVLIFLLCTQESDLVRFSTGRRSFGLFSPSWEDLSKSSPAHILQVPSSNLVRTALAGGRRRDGVH